MQELRKRSEALVPAFEFTNYQVNKDQKSPTNGNNGGLMMNSFNEIKVKRKKMRVLNDFDGLPGLSEPLVDQKASENLEDDISHTIREEQKKQNTINLLSGFKRLLYTGLLLLLAICRSSLYPLMAAIPQPVIHKLVWRSILLSSMLAPVVAVETRKSQRLFSDYYKDRKQLVDLAIVVVSFSFWIFCAIYASHHCSIAHATAIANSHFLFVSLFRLEAGASLASIVALALLLFTSDSNSTPDTYLNLNNQSPVERLVNGKIVALFGSFSSAIYFVVSRQMRSNNTPTFVTLNISLFGIFVFLILGYFFEGFMEGDENDTIFSLFLPKVFGAMLVVAFISGLVPNLLTTALSKVFTPGAMSIATFSQPPIAVFIAWLIGLQYFPHWPVWLAMALLLVSQIIIREEVMQAAVGTVMMDDRSADSAENKSHLDLQTSVLV